MNPGTDTLRRQAGIRVPKTGGLAGFWADKRGVSATEFAMILPFLLFLLVGMEVITGALNHDRKISRIASSVTDLVAQEQTVDPSGLDALLKVGDTILAPYSSTELEVIVASVSFDEDGDPSIDWSRDNHGSAADGWSPGAAPPITLPDTIATPNTSIVVGQTNLTYRPTFANLYKELNKFFSGDSIDSIDLSDVYYVRPRLTDTVTCEDCPG